MPSLLAVQYSRSVNRARAIIVLVLALTAFPGCDRSGPTNGTTVEPSPADASTTGEGETKSEVAKTGKQKSKRTPPPDHRPGKIFDITFDDLALEMPLETLFEPSMLTPRVKELDGRNVRLKGFIFAGGVFQSSGIKNFPFVMNTQCKFGPQGLAYCVILVDLKDGVTANFTTYPITVEGQLSVRPYDADGFTWTVYHILGTKVY